MCWQSPTAPAAQGRRTALLLCAAMAFLALQPMTAAQPAAAIADWARPAAADVGAEPAAAPASLPPPVTATAVAAAAVGAAAATAADSGEVPAAFPPVGGPSAPASGQPPPPNSVDAPAAEPASPPPPLEDDELPQAAPPPAAANASSAAEANAAARFPGSTPFATRPVPVSQLPLIEGTTGDALAIPVETERGWRLFRATYYGAPVAITAAFDPTRGEGSFGVLPYGACGYTNSDGTIPFARDAVAAAADQNADYPGSCGRCYQVRCRSGLILDNDLRPLDIRAPFMTYLPDINRTVTDTRGRAWPGNMAEMEGRQFTQCWNDTPGASKKTVQVRVIDTCPCTQVLPEGAPGVKPGGEVRRQHWCCGGIQHLDLSYWAFESLAHPVYGMLMGDYRPVDCTTGAPLDFLPGSINGTHVYASEGTGAGWSFFPYAFDEAFWNVEGAGVDGGGATCVNLPPRGGLSFRCRECARQGYQPLANATTMELLLKPNSNSTDPFFSATPSGQPISGVKVYLLNEEAQKYCNAEVFLGGGASDDTNATVVRPTRSEGPYYLYRLPLSAFRCDYEGAFLEEITNISLENTNKRAAIFCLAELRLVRGNEGGNTTGGSGGGRVTAPDDAAAATPLATDGGGLGSS